MNTTRFRLFFDFDREERWLAAMAGEGFMLVGRSCPGLYRFRRSDPENTVIRIDHRYFRKKRDFADYKVLFEDSGWKHIAGGRYSGTQYFRKLNSSALDDIFSDRASKAGRYRRWSSISLSLAAALLPLAVVMLILDHVNCRALLNPRLLYQTPGLWEKTSADFWRAFLFETPFALLRGFPLLIILAIVVFVSISAVCAAIVYRRSID